MDVAIKISVVLEPAIKGKDLFESSTTNISWSSPGTRSFVLGVMETGLARGMLSGTMTTSSPDATRSSGIN